MVAYWIYIIIDDRVFIEKYWTVKWFYYLAVWALYFLVYFFFGFRFTIG